jgi:hypothetical protein
MSKFGFACVNRKNLCDLMVEVLAVFHEVVSSNLEKCTCTNMCMCMHTHVNIIACFFSNMQMTCDYGDEWCLIIVVGCHMDFLGKLFLKNLKT